MNDAMAKRMYENLHLKDGMIIQANTHAEFLNKVFNTKYINYMKTIWPVPGTDNQINVWMVRLDGVERNGWINYEDENVIFELNLGGSSTWGGEDICMRNREKPYRIAVCITEKFGQRQYVIKGLYKYSDKCTLEKHILNKIN